MMTTDLPHIKVYLTSEDKKRVADKAADVSLSASSYLRQILIDAGIAKDDYQQHGTSGKGRRKQK